jgi:MoaA/NifB/PqqE/SkfB family radical SAM enzyme
MAALVNRTPWMADCVKRLLGTRCIVNSALYKKYVFARARAADCACGTGIPGIMIETTVNCNAKCIMCDHSNRTMTGSMSMPLFEKIIDECAREGVTNIGLSVYGEPLMDPHFMERVKMIRRRGLNYAFYSNASLLSESVTHQLFALGGLTDVNFSVNGFSRAAYEKVMVGLKRDETYANILRFLKEKRICGRHSPVVSVSCVKTKYTSDELPSFVRYWRQFTEVDKVITADLWDRIGDAKEEDIGKFGPLSQKGLLPLPCRELWARFLIYYDGRVTPCCVDNDKRELVIGDVTVQTLREVAASKALRQLRQMHLEDRRKQHPICGECSFHSVWF